MPPLNCHRFHLFFVPPQETAELPMGAMSVQQEEMFTEGGLCVTCRLSSFSLYIFHPYGNAMRKSDAEFYFSRTFRRSARYSYSAYNTK